MKRFFPIVITLILICSMLFTGCNSNENTEVSAKDALSVNLELLSVSLAEDGVLDKQYTFKELKDIIIKWAEENGIEVESDSENYLVLAKAAAGEIKNVESFTFHTAIDFRPAKALNNSDDEVLSAAAAVMTAIENAENHGPLRAVFTNVKNGQPVGAADLDPSYLDYDNFIDVTYNQDTVLYNTFAANSNMAAVKNLNITSPTYTKAYKISFNGITGQSAYTHRGAYPNPIKTIGDLLASCQTSTVLFELASFEGGIYSDNIPGKVTATIVLHENDVESFTKKFNTSYEKVEKMYEDVDNENISFKYTMTPVNLPSKVISKEDTENIVSLMYTMINGTYLRDEKDETVAVSNIGKITTKNGDFQLTINAKSLDDETMTELEGVVKTICGLSDITYKKTGSSRVWTNAPETPLVANLADTLSTDCSSVLEMKHVAEFTATDKNLNLVSWGTNENDAAKDLEKIFEYMAIAGAEITTE